AEALKKRLLEKINNEVRSGLDPELLSVGIELATLYVEAGAKTFGRFAKSMVDDLGENIKPYLKSLYLAARNMPGVDRSGMDPADAVESMTEAQVDQAISDTIAAEKSRDERTRNNLERDRGDATASDGVGEADVQTQRRGTGQGARPGTRGTGEEGRGPDGDRSVSTRQAPSHGERGDFSPYRDQQRSEPSDSTTGGSDAAGGDLFGVTGISSRPDTTAGIEEALA